MYIRFLL